MPAVRMPMRNIREILRLKYHVPPFSHRDIAMSCNVSASTVGDTLQRFRVAGLGWPLPPDFSDASLEAALYYQQTEAVDAAEVRLAPDWAAVHRELSRKHVTLSLVWEEYRRDQVDGYGYSWFCNNYRLWAATANLVMRQVHKLGEKTFVDYAGGTVPVIQRETGTPRLAQVFVGVLGCSNYTYAEASWSQEISNWVQAHVRMFTFFGGVTEVVVPDNLKSGVTKACYYEPELNPTYHEMAKHYGVAVIPARKGHPKDKAKVEKAVQLVQRWVLAVLRKRTFYSLDELNEAIWELLERLNDRPFKKLPGSRRQRFEEDEKATLKPLPAQPFEYGEWKKARVSLDYHIEVDHHYYSLPFKLVRQIVEVRLTANTVEVLHDSIRVASHKRSFHRGYHTTIADHMPSHHQFCAEWSPARVLNWAGKHGQAVKQMADGIMENREHPEQGFRACMRLVQLSRKFGADRLNEIGRAHV